MSQYFFVFQTAGSDPRLRYLQVMITRLLLSLKKANASHEYAWNFGEPTAHTAMRFAERRGGISTRDEIRMDTFVSEHEGTQSRA